jgi:hypothetical protein
MKSFKQWLKENFGGSANFPSGAEEEGDGGDILSRRLEKPGAFPTYGDDLPITKKNRSNKKNRLRR